ncbi:hypothetical protein ACLOJK_013029 [Asimina triloba]
MADLPTHTLVKEYLDKIKEVVDDIAKNDIANVVDNVDYEARNHPIRSGGDNFESHGDGQMWHQTEMHHKTANFFHEWIFLMCHYPVMKT